MKKCARIVLRCRLLGNWSGLQWGFTLLELLVTIAIISLLAGLLLAAISKVKANSRIASCASNLRQVAIAFTSFAHDHNDKVPWLVAPSEGGSGDPFNQDAYLHFRPVRTELVSPKLLRCPSDTGRNAAETFEQLSDANLSYFVGLEGSILRPESMLSGDRNVSGPYNLEPCGAWLGATGTPISVDTEWTEALHNLVGNIGLADGSVHRLTTRQLQAQAEVSDRVNANNHARVPSQN